MQGEKKKKNGPGVPLAEQGGDLKEAG